MKNYQKVSRGEHKKIAAALHRTCKCYRNEGQSTRKKKKLKYNANALKFRPVILKSCHTGSHTLVDYLYTENFTSLYWKNLFLPPKCSVYLKTLAQGLWRMQDYHPFPNKTQLLQQKEKEARCKWKG